MKLLNYFIVLFISISIVSCGSDDDTPSFDLSTANLAGTHDMIAYESDSSTETTFGDSVIVVETETIEGETFTNTQLTLAGTSFTFTGSYVQQIETETTDGTTEESIIITLADSGTFSLNTDDETITFNGTDLNGEYDVDTFTSTMLVISQEGAMTIDDEGFTTTTNTTITFEK